MSVRQLIDVVQQRSECQVSFRNALVRRRVRGDSRPGEEIAAPLHTSLLIEEMGFGCELIVLTSLMYKLKG